MSENDFPPPGRRPSRPARGAPGPWRTLPLKGRFGLVYEDAAGIRSSRVLDARELKLGPGRTLLCGIDVRTGSFRGFRVDRIRRLTDGEAGAGAQAGILDRLLAHAEAQRRALAARPRAPAAA